MTDYALVKANVVKYVARQATAPNAQAQGVDLVEDVTGLLLFPEPGWIRSGVRQYAKPAAQVTAESNAATVEAQLRAYLALSSSTAAQDRTAIRRMIRAFYGIYDAAT